MEQALTSKQRNDFLDKIRPKTDEDLISIYLNRNGYQSEYIDLVIEELQNRNIVLNELTSPDAAQEIVMKRKTDDELIEIYTHPDHYEKKYVEFAKKEITARNLPIDVLNSERKNNEHSFRQGEQGRYIAAGYIFSVLGGLIGLVIGCQYAYSKHKNVDGEKFYKYNAPTRKHGRRMLIALLIASSLYVSAALLD